VTFVVGLSASAQRDFYQAQAYYDAQAPEQTKRFIDEFFATTKRLSDFPYSAPAVRGAARRVNLRVFPYQLWYRIRDEAMAVEIVAVLHYRQDPARLDERLHSEH
jgi:plasmid stabilization system protein ParE